MIQNLLKQVQNGLSKIQRTRLPRIAEQTSKLSVSDFNLQTSFKSQQNESNTKQASNQSIDLTTSTQNSKQQNDLKPNHRELIVFNSFTKTLKSASASGKPIYVTNDKINQTTQLAKAYICGPTVYDDSHIGHALTYVRFDLIRRILKRYCSVDLVSIMNITDIDDKIIKRALEENKSVLEVSNNYLSSFFKDLYSLNILPFNAYVPVTSQMNNIIDYIQLLEHNGYAYVNEKTGDIDLDTSKVDNELENFQTDSNLPGRRSQSDFTLWKVRKSNEPYWEYESNTTNRIIKGRPGWHVECSVISNAILGNRIDFHFRGHDLLFPHHVNESRCCKAFNKCISTQDNSSNQLGHQPIHSWSNLWMHFGKLTINEEKMSKSLNNFIQIKKFLRKHPKNTLRLLCIIHPYRRDLTYDDGNLSVAIDFDRKLVNFYQMINNRKDELISKSKLKFQDTDDLNTFINSFVEHNLDGIADDFDLNRGFSKLIELTDHLIKNQHLWTVYDLVKAELIVSDYLDSLGFVYLGSSLSKNRNPNDQYIIRKLIDYRKEIRKLALQEKMDLKNNSPNIDSILNATDSIRRSLSTNQLMIQDDKFVSKNKKK